MRPHTLELENGSRATLTIEPPVTVDLHITFKAAPSAPLKATVAQSVANDILAHHQQGYRYGAYRQVNGRLLLFWFEDVLSIT